MTPFLGVQKLIALFNEHDTNGDGVLDKKEFAGMIMSLTQKKDELADAAEIIEDERMVAKLFAEVCLCGVYMCLRRCC